jgi:hypothetical protein
VTKRHVRPNYIDEEVVKVSHWKRISEHHRSGGPWHEAPTWAVALKDLVLFTWEVQMAAIDDLKSAVSDLAAELSRNNAEIESLLTKITSSTSSEADVAAAAASIRDLIASNKAEVDKADAVLNPPAPVPPETPPAG